MSYHRAFSASMALALAAAVLGGFSCAHQQRLMGGAVERIPNRDVVALSADDIVLLMRRAGFSDMQILDYGPKVRNDLAASGGSRVVSHNFVEAIFAVHDDTVYASTRQRGTFRYEPETQTFR